MTTGISVPSTITCVECGGKSHLLNAPGPEQEWEPGDVAAYRCAECQERWDIVVDDTGDGSAP